MTGRITATLALVGILATTVAIPGSAQEMVAARSHPAIELAIVLDAHHVAADTATFLWVGAEPRLVLSPSAGADRLKEALRALSRYMWQCNNQLERSDETVDLPLIINPRRGGYDKLWNQIKEVDRAELAGHEGPVQVFRLGFTVGDREDPSVVLEGVTCGKGSGTLESLRPHFQ